MTRLAISVSISILIIVVPVAVALDRTPQGCRLFGILLTGRTQVVVAVEGLALERIRVQDLLSTRAALLHLFWDSWLPADRYERRRSSAAAAGRRGSGWP